jgi:hypothetical protein
VKGAVVYWEAFVPARLKDTLVMVGNLLLWPMTRSGVCSSGE